MTISSIEKQNKVQNENCQNCITKATTVSLISATKSKKSVSIRLNIEIEKAIHFIHSLWLVYSRS